MPHVCKTQYYTTIRKANWKILLGLFFIPIIITTVVTEEDVDECKNGTHNCDTNADCTNTIGSFTCECSSNFNYFGSGTNCTQDICKASGFDGWVKKAPHCLKVIVDPTDWFQAVTECDKLGAELLAVHEANELGTVRAAVENSRMQSEYHWIGLHDVEQEGFWLWSDHTPTPYLNWAEGEPNGKGLSGPGTGVDEDCVKVDTKVKSFWYDSPCNVSLPYICKKNFDECKLESHNCHPEHGLCENTALSFKCRCVNGYTGDGTKCSDEDECATGNNDCDSEHAECHNFISSYTCSCLEGRTGPGTWNTCADLDECSIYTSLCELKTSTCVNTDGSFICHCKAGYTEITHGDTVYCGDTNECTEVAEGRNLMLHRCDHDHGVCRNIIGSYLCECKSGHTGDGKRCSDLNECVERVGSCQPFSEQCVNLDGSFFCQCSRGYINKNGVCNDIDECEGNVNDSQAYNCPKQKAACTNTDGSYWCECNKGYHKVGEICKDKDECHLKTHDCATAMCSNTEGSFQCYCPPGYRLDYHTSDQGDWDCKDVDECGDNSGAYRKCDVSSSSCINSVGGYECKCKDGYTKKHKQDPCIDVDECESTGCQCSNSYCLNTQGSFRCPCLQGFHREDPDPIHCVDTDECMNETSCDMSRSNCTNLPGTFTCECWHGYVSIDQIRCGDEDECLTGNTCHPQSEVCVNSVGSYRCECAPGYKDTGNTCTDIDECIEMPVCPDKTPESPCINVNGSFLCGCQPPYLYIQQGNTCRCPQGYRMSRDYDITSDCSDVDECTMESEECQAHCEKTLKTNQVEYDCINEVGSYSCACSEALVMDDSAAHHPGTATRKAQLPITIFVLVGVLTCLATLLLVALVVVVRGRRRRGSRQGQVYPGDEGGEVTEKSDDETETSLPVVKVNDAPMPAAAQDGGMDVVKTKKKRKKGVFKSFRREKKIKSDKVQEAGSPSTASSKSTPPQTVNMDEVMEWNMQSDATDTQGDIISSRSGQSTDIRIFKEKSEVEPEGLYIPLHHTGPDWGDTEDVREDGEKFAVDGTYANLFASPQSDKLNNNNQSVMATESNHGKVAGRLSSDSTTIPGYVRGNQSSLEGGENSLEKVKANYSSSSESFNEKDLPVIDLTGTKHNPHGIYSN